MDMTTRISPRRQNVIRRSPEERVAAQARAATPSAQRTAALAEAAVKAVQERTAKANAEPKLRDPQWSLGIRGANWGALTTFGVQGLSAKAAHERSFKAGEIQDRADYWSDRIEAEAAPQIAARIAAGEPSDRVRLEEGRAAAQRLRSLREAAQRRQGQMARPARPNTLSMVSSGEGFRSLMERKES